MLDIWKKQTKKKVSDTRQPENTLDVKCAPHCGNVVASNDQKRPDTLIVNDLLMITHYNKLNTSEHFLLAVLQ